MNTIKEAVLNEIHALQNHKRKKRIQSVLLENKIKKDLTNYIDIGGYAEFYLAIQELCQKGLLLPIKNKNTNGRDPSLPLDYWIMPVRMEGSWNKLDMLKMSDLIDFSFYHQHASFQTNEEWKRIQSVYQFLKEKKQHRLLSIEERSLQLFGNEKFLTDGKCFPEGKGFLNRIGLSYESIYAERQGEPFVFWVKPGVNYTEIERVLIIENLSFFHTAKTLLNQDDLHLRYDLIIYGAGKQIENSFSFFKHFFLSKPYDFFYVGDLDPEGYSIYARLCEKYEEHPIQPAHEIYKRMLDHMNQANEVNNQVENINHLNFFIKQIGDELCKQRLLLLWEQKKRIPQEVLNLETW